MSVRFVKGGVTIDIQNPDRTNTIKLEKSQVVNRSAAGDRYRYDRAVDVQYMRLRWSELRESEKTDLETFFDVSADGVMNSFTFTDQRGTAWTAYFVDPELEFTERADATASATTFTSGGVAYPTTTRNKGVWSVECTLEVTAA